MLLVVYIQVSHPISHAQLSFPKAWPLGQGGWLGRVILCQPQSSQLQPSPVEMRTAHQLSPPPLRSFTLKASLSAHPCPCSLDHPSTPGQVTLSLHLRDCGWDMGVFAFREPLRRSSYSVVSNRGGPASAKLHCPTPQEEVEGTRVAHICIPNRTHKWPFSRGRTPVPKCAYVSA